MYQISASGVIVDKIILVFKSTIPSNIFAVGMSTVSVGNKGGNSQGLNLFLMFPVFFLNNQYLLNFRLHQICIHLI